MSIFTNDSIQFSKNLKSIKVKFNAGGDIKNVTSVYSNIQNQDLSPQLTWKTDDGGVGYDGYSVLSGYGTAGNYCKYFTKDNFGVSTSISLGAATGKTTFIEKIDEHIFMNIGSIIFRSSDGGKTFSSVLSSINNAYINSMSIAYGNGTIIVDYNDNNGNNIYYSKNKGLTWTFKRVYNVNTFGNIVFGNGKFIYYSKYEDSTYRGKYHYSEDGVNWIENTITTTFRPYWIGFANNRFVGVGGLNTTNTPLRCYSDDGINWSVASTNSFQTNSRFIGYVNGMYYAINDNLSNVFYSNDGVSWSNSSVKISPKPSTLLDIIFSQENNKFYLVSSNNIFSSNDAINWTSVYTNPQTFTDGKLFIY